MNGRAERIKIDQHPSRISKRCSLVVCSNRGDHVLGTISQYQLIGYQRKNARSKAIERIKQRRIKRACERFRKLFESGEMLMRKAFSSEKTFFLVFLLWVTVLFYVDHSISEQSKSIIEELE